MHEQQPQFGGFKNERSERDELVLGKLSSGETVFDRWKSHLHSNSALSEYLPQALQKTNPNSQDFHIETVDFGNEIGFSNCVETNDQDEIVFAQRVGRFGLSRFVKNKESTPSSKLTVILKKIPEGYLLLTAFIGPKAEKEPWDSMADKKSLDFWKNHALIWGTEKIVPGTETDKNPW